MDILELLIGTKNRAKQRSLNQIVSALPIKVLLPLQVSGLPQTIVEEEQDSHLGNAREKALVWSRSFHGLTVSTDGGLLIPGLGQNWNSLTTKRFAGDTAGDPERIKMLLDLLKEHSNGDRRAQFVEAVAIANDGHLVDSWEAVSAMGWLNEGYEQDQICDEFWISAIWSFPTLGKNYSALSSEERMLVDAPWMSLKPHIQDAIMSLLNKP